MEVKPYSSTTWQRRGKIVKSKCLKVDLLPHESNIMTTDLMDQYPSHVGTGYKHHSGLYRGIIRWSGRV